ncbi:MAG: membrane protein [Parcubacteria group bacterium Athens1014_26]|nr:MAG: membrane protein [Parcubacteria group bacterium Athens1014_26]
MNRKLFYFLKVAVTVFLIWLLFSKIDFLKFLKEIGSVKISYFILAFFLMLAVWLANTLRWKALLEIFDNKLSVFRLFLYNLSSIFYTTVLPGGKLAGDTVRAYQVSKDHQGALHEKKRLFLLIFIDRAMGLLGLVLFLSFYFIFVFPAINILRPNSFFAGVLILLSSLFGILLVFSDKLDWLIIFLKKMPWVLLRNFLTFVLDSLNICRVNKLKLLKSLMFSLISVFLSALSVYAMAMGLGLAINYWTIAFINSLAVILIVIPITVGGIGLREGGIVYLLIQFGIDSTKALALSVLNLSVMMILALVGGLIEIYFQFLNKKRY